LVDYAKIHRLVLSDDAEERNEAVDQITNNFQNFPDKDKEQASNDLLALTKDKDSFVRMDAAFALGTAFQYVTDKAQATKELLKLAKDEDSVVRMGVAGALGMAFQYVTDKKHAVNELLELINDEDDEVRRYAAGAFEPAFQYITDKEQAWNELLKLIKDEDSWVQMGAAYALGTAFQYITDKEQAWNKLLKLIKDEDSWVQMGAAYALGTAFQYISDKKQATKELLELTKDGVSVVSVSANYSLGKISIYKATEAESEDGLKDEMAKAIGYFEKSSQESKFYFNPAKFCLPFYRSYIAVIFRKEEAKEEIERNLEEAKQAVEGSGTSEKLIEVVENLENALQEAQKSRELDKIQSDLYTYMQYCNRAEELLKITEEKAPNATKLFRKGLPIVKKTIEELLEEIGKDTKILCEAAEGSEAEKYTAPTCKIVNELIKIRNPDELSKCISRLRPNLKFLAENLPEKDGDFIFTKVENIETEEYLEDKLALVNEIIVFVTPYIKMTNILQNIWDKLDEITVFFDPAIQETITITVGPEILGTGIKRVITIPVKEIAYSDIRKDLERISKESLLNVIPKKLINKIKEYIVRNKDELFDDLGQI